MLRNFLYFCRPLVVYIADKSSYESITFLYVSQDDGVWAPTSSRSELWMEAGSGLWTKELCSSWLFFAFLITSSTTLASSNSNPDVSSIFIPIFFIFQVPLVGDSTELSLMNGWNTVVWLSILFDLQRLTCFRLCTTAMALQNTPDSHCYVRPRK